MKIPESRAARERYELRRTVENRPDPHVSDYPGIVHGYPAPADRLAIVSAAKPPTQLAPNERTGLGWYDPRIGRIRRSSWAYARSLG